MINFSLLKKRFVKKSPPILVGRICYMNVAPVYYGIDQGLPLGNIEIIDGSPSALNRMLAVGGLDISPVSSIAYAHHQEEWELLPDLSISCHGRVMSVLLASRYPLEELNDRIVFLTDESASAVALLKLILAKKDITPRFKTGRLRKGGTAEAHADAVLVIGNTALSSEWERHYNYVWDLGELWEELTGNPFVFALWAVRKRFASRYPHIVTAVKDLFQKSRSLGLENLDQISDQAAVISGLESAFCRRYYQSLAYDLQQDKINGLEKFFDELYKGGFLRQKVELAFFNGNQQKVIPFPLSQKKITHQKANT